MSLADYKGPSNSGQLWPHLVGEKILGVVEENGRVHLIMESGSAVTFSSLGDSVGPSYWVTSRKDWEKVVRERRERIRRGTAEIQRLDEVAPAEITP